MTRRGGRMALAALILLAIDCFGTEDASQKESVKPTPRTSRTAVATTVSEERQAVGAQALARSLRVVGGLRPGTPLIALMPEVHYRDHKAVERLREAGWQVLERPLPRPSKLLWGFLEGYENCYLKLYVWGRDFEGFDRVVYLDSDMIAASTNASRLLYGSEYQPDVGEILWTQDMPLSLDKKSFYGNAGMFVARPNKETYRLVTGALRLHQSRSFGDQDLLNDMFSLKDRGFYKSVAESVGANASGGLSYRKVNVSFNTQMWGANENVTAAYYHFTASKPWLVTEGGEVVVRQSFLDGNKVAREAGARWKAAFESENHTRVRVIPPERNLVPPYIRSFMHHSPLTLVSLAALSCLLAALGVRNRTLLRLMRLDCRVWSRGNMAVRACRPL